MKLFNDEIQIVRGEDFTYEFSIKNKDGSPYIICSKLDNPYLLITVSTGKYYKFGRAVYNYWLKITDRRDKPSTFYLTKPVHLDASVITNNSSPEDTFKTNSDIYEEMVRLKTEGICDEDYKNYSVYYVDTPEGNKYYYWNGTEYEIYNNDVKVQFNTVDTLDWVEQSYNLGIKVVSGALRDGYKDMKSHEQPLKNFSMMDNIDCPSKITVFSNIDGSMEVEDERKEHNFISNRT